MLLPAFYIDPERRRYDSFRAAVQEISRRESVG